MPIYTITYTANLSQDVVMNIDAPDQSTAINQSSDYIDEIILDPGFINDNIEIELCSIEENQPSYTPLTSRKPLLDSSFQNSGYTPISSLYNASSTASSSNYTRLT